MQLHVTENLTPSLEALGCICMHATFILSGNMNNWHLETVLYTLSKNAHCVINTGP